MTRLKKILYLTAQGEIILYHLRESDQRLFVDGIRNDDGEIQRFKLTSADQKIAGQMIDLLYYERIMEV